MKSVCHLYVGFNPREQKGLVYLSLGTYILKVPPKLLLQA